MENNKTKPQQVIELIKWNSVFTEIFHMSFGSTFTRLNDLNTQKLHQHTKNSSPNYFEQDSSRSFPLPYEHRPPSTVITYQTESTCMTIR